MAFFVLAAIGGGCEKAASKPVIRSVVYEGFDYPAGKVLIAQTGGTGFAKGWEVGSLIQDHVNDFVIGEGSLAYLGLESNGNRLKCTALGNPQYVMREFGPDFMITKGTRYISFLIRPEGPPIGVNVAAGQTNVPVSSLAANARQTDTYCGITLYYGTDFEVFFGKPGTGDSNQYVMASRVRNQFSSGVEAKVGEVAHLVIRVDFSNGQISDYRFYVNPGATEPPKGAMIGLHDARVPSLVIYNQGEFSIDEIRVVDHYEDIAPKEKGISFF